MSRSYAGRLTSVIHRVIHRVIHWVIHWVIHIILLLCIRVRDKITTYSNIGRKASRRRKTTIYDLGYYSSLQGLGAFHRGLGSYIVKVSYSSYSGRCIIIIVCTLYDTLYLSTNPRHHNVHIDDTSP